MEAPFFSVPRIKRRSGNPCNGNNPREVPVAPMLDGVSEFAPGLWQCRNDYAFALLQPPAMEGVKDLLLVMVFRPVGRFA